MNPIRKFFTYLVYYPERIALRIWNKVASLIPDELFLKVKFRLTMGYWMDFKDPKTYNEKLQWLKLYDRNPAYTKMVDKVAAKEYVAQVAGKQFVIPTIGVWEKAEDIPWDKLPNQFVAKVTHDSGGIVICKDKNQLNTKEAVRKLSKALHQDYYNLTREWPYKNVKRQIIVEQYMVDESGYELKDYKFFCFDGEPKMLFVATDREKENEETKFDFFDTEFRLLPFTNGHEHAQVTPAKTKGFDTMMELARKLSKGIKHVRVDLYDVNGKVYFGEMTFFHWSGFVPFEPEEWDAKIGKWLILSEEHEE